MALPILPKAGNLIVHTGNIINWTRLKAAVAQSATSELQECITATVTSWLQTTDKDTLQGASAVDCSDPKFLEKLEPEERLELKLTVKIFISSCEGENIVDAIEQVMSALGVQFIESLILSVPEEHTSLEYLKPLWSALEDQVEANRVYSLGISDLSKFQLEELFNWAKVKPRINQVNLTTCCVIPAELNEYAKENDIQLLTHNDPPVILSAEDFQGVLSEVFKSSSADSALWLPSWVTRYSVLVKGRGIIKSKGYLLRATRDVNKLPYTQ